MLSTDRSAGTHGQLSTAKHTHKSFSHIRDMIYDFMLFPQMKQSHFNNDQDK